MQEYHIKLSIIIIKDIVTLAIQMTHRSTQIYFKIYENVTLHLNNFQDDISSN